MSEALTQSLILIIKTLGSLYLLAILLRFLLQAARADFYNPASQALVKITAPLLNPLRKVIPGYHGLDLASLVLAVLINSILTTLIILIAEPDIFPMVEITSFISWGLAGTISMTIKIYFYALVISIIASWVAPHSGNPMLLLVQQLLHPLQSRVRNLIPSMGGLDISPIFLFLGLSILDDKILFSFAQSLRLPFQYVIGF